MKKVLTIISVLVIVSVNAQNPCTYFNLTDSVFQIGSIYAECTILNQEKPLMRPEEQPCLDSVILFMKNHPGIILEIGCHTDQRGSDTFNLRFSQDRANYIENYFISKGVSGFDLAAVGYGESQLLNGDARIKQETDKNKKEELYAQNRRTEFKILRIPQPVFRYSDSVFQVGQVIFPLVIHEFSSCVVRPESFAIMDSLANWLIAHPEIKIEIGHHVEARGPAEFNVKLTECRAKAIAAQLKKRNVPETQYTAVGYGESKPIVSETYINEVKSFYGRDELYRINRRVEISIIQITPP